MSQPGSIYQFGPLQLDTRARRLLRDGTPLTLPPKSFELLQVLLENHGRAMSKSELLEALWPDAQVEEGNLAFQVSVLRKALGPEAGAWIETVPRHGYRLSAPVVTHPATATKTASVRPTVLGRRQWYTAGLGIAVVAVAAAVWFASRERTGISMLAPVPLASFPGDEITPSLSPDGKDVAFVWKGRPGDNWDVYVKLNGVEEPLRITSSEEVEFNPAWSPDGRHIAFARQKDSATTDILVKPYPDGPERLVGQARACFLTGAPYNKILDWHPDGEHLVVAGAERGRGCALSALSTVTGTLTPLTEPPPSMTDLAPAVSWDGRAVAFMRGSTWSTFKIYTVALSAELKPSGSTRPVTTENRIELWPAWLPGSKEILFSGGYSNAAFTLFAAPASGTRKARQIQSAGAGLYPSVSAGGNLVYASAGPSFASMHRLEIPSDPNSPAKVTDIAPSTFAQQGPVYSPDGTRIAFESERSGYREIWISSADGTQLRRLTHFDGPAVQGPRWSPDGTRIVCSIAAREHRDIYVIDSERGTSKRLTADASDHGGVAWSGDGEWIYFHSNQSGEFQVWKMPATGGNAVQLTRNGGFTPQESPDGRSLYFTKRGEQTSLWRMPAEGGPEVRLIDALYQPAGTVVVADGVYFMTPAEPSDRSSPWFKVHLLDAFKVRFLDVRSGRTRDVATVTGPIGWGLSVAPDRRSLLFVRKKTGAYDLMLAKLSR